MSLSIFDHGDGRFRLVRDGREVGWVEDRTIAFRGFADAEAARAAATAAYNVLAAWAVRQLRSAPAPMRRRALGVHRDGSVESLTLGGVPVGRLRRFGADDFPDDARDVGFELYLPARVAPGLALGAAQLIDTAIAGRRTDAAAAPSAG